MRRESAMPNCRYRVGKPVNPPRQPATEKQQQLSSFQPVKSNPACLDHCQSPAVGRLSPPPSLGGQLHGSSRLAFLVDFRALVGLERSELWVMLHRPVLPLLLAPHQLFSHAHLEFVLPRPGMIFSMAPCGPTVLSGAKRANLAIGARSNIFVLFRSRCRETVELLAARLWRVSLRLLCSFAARLG